MKYMMMVKADKNYENGAMPDPKLMEAIGKHAEFHGSRVRTCPSGGIPQISLEPEVKRNGLHS